MEAQCAWIDSQFQWRRGVPGLILNSNGGAVRLDWFSIPMEARCAWVDFQRNMEAHCAWVDYQPNMEAQYAWVDFQPNMDAQCAWIDSQFKNGGAVRLG